ncbi:MAG: acetate--CoA ligase family protein, partial [Bacteroidales bacterium]|nr:acetate--CoA ligase family protein [Bacteroidales bacterium]
MINKELISPKSIVIVGGSESFQKPGGNVLRNLIETKYSGKLYVVNPKATSVQGIKCYPSVSDLPQVDLAVLAIPAHLCPDVTDILCNKKNCRAIIVFSAGFHEDGPQGALLEEKLVEITNNAGASLIGPNCIGVLTPDYSGVFIKPIPQLDPMGVDLISGSGATIVFILEASMQLGLKFSSVFSVGNSAQIGVEEVLEYLDNSYVPGKSSPVKLLYIESINDPQKLLKHSRSLIKKGARIAAIKAGYSSAGSRAASSHTGALASPDKAVNALFHKAGIIRCYGRNELATVASVLTYPTPKGKKVAIITHAGGPAVMLTDVLSANKIDVPEIKGEKANQLLEKLFPGSSVSNPIDFLATGTAEQLGHIIDACENNFDVDAMVVIFGSPGLTTVFDVYEVLEQKIKSCKKPIYPVLPSVVNVAEEIALFQKNGGISFPEETIFGTALAKVLNNISDVQEIELPPVDKELIRSVIDNSEDGYLAPTEVQKLLDAAGINRAKEAVAQTVSQAQKMAKEIGFPLVMKVVGPVHKSDVGGVVLDVTEMETLVVEFNRMMKIPETTSILLQPMLSGTQLFIGAKKEDKFGHLIMCGLGGIFVEAIKDINSALSPVSKKEATSMIKTLRGYKLIEGTRGQEGVNEFLFINSIQRVSALCNAAPEIFEMDLNPLLGNSKQVIAVDARIRIV